MGLYGKDQKSRWCPFSQSYNPPQPPGSPPWPIPHPTQMVFARRVPTLPIPCVHPVQTAHNTFVRSLFTGFHVSLPTYVTFLMVFADFLSPVCPLKVNFFSPVCAHSVSPENEKNIISAQLCLSFFCGCGMYIICVLCVWI